MNYQSVVLCMEWLRWERVGQPHGVIIITRIIIIIITHTYILLGLPPKRRAPGIIRRWRSKD